MIDFIQKIKNNYQEGIGGNDLQFQMSIRNRYPEGMKIPETAKLACVLMLLYPQHETWHLVLMQRSKSSNPNDVHSGQISFPGRQFEPQNDKSLLDCALREANEEVGIVPSDVHIIGQMTELYIPVSNFRVVPFLGYMNHAPDFQLQASEVRSIVTVPIAELLHPENRKTKDITLSETLTLEDVPYFDLQQKHVWGATAMMLNELWELFTRHIPKKSI